jgi:hypothetical protein
LAISSYLASREEQVQPEDETGAVEREPQFA